LVHSDASATLAVLAAAAGAQGPWKGPAVLPEGATSTEGTRAEGTEARAGLVAVATFRCPRTGLTPLLAALVHGSSWDAAANGSGGSSSGGGGGEANSGCTGAAAAVAAPATAAGQSLAALPPPSALVAVLAALLDAGADPTAAAALYDGMSAPELAAKFGRSAALEAALEAARAAALAIDDDEDDDNGGCGVADGATSAETNAENAQTTEREAAAPATDTVPLPPAPPAPATPTPPEATGAGCGQPMVEAEQRDWPARHLGTADAVWHRHCLAAAAQQGGCSWALG
jgi:hypothetical protein